MKRILGAIFLFLSCFAGSVHAATTYQTWNVYYTHCCDDEGDDYIIYENGKPKIKYVVQRWTMHVNPTVLAECVPEGVDVIDYIEQVGATVSRSVQFYRLIDDDDGPYYQLISGAVITGNASEACLQGYVNANIPPDDPQPTPPNVPANQLPGGDFDGDGITNANDPDDDNDGVLDVNDPAPFDPHVPNAGGGTPDPGGGGTPGGGGGGTPGGGGGGNPDPGGGTGTPDPPGGNGKDPWTGPKNQGVPGGAGNKNPNLIALPGFGQTFGLAIGSWAAFSPTSQQPVTITFEIPWVNGETQTFATTSVPSSDTPLGVALNDLRMLVRTSLSVFIVWMFLSRIYRDLVMY